MSPREATSGRLPPEGGCRWRRGRAGSAAAAGWVVALAAAAHPTPVLAQEPASAPAGGGVRFTVEQIEGGRAQFHRTCAPCHGRNMVNAGTTVFDLRKFPLDQSDRFVNSVTNGKGNMPSFKEQLAPEQIALLWAYVGTRGGKEP